MPFDWKPLAAKLSLDTANLTDDNAGEAILAKIGELAPLAEKVTGLESQIATLSRTAVPDVDVDVLEEAAANVTDGIERLVADKKINDAQRTELSNLLCGTAGARPAVCLSLKASKAAGFGDEKLAKRILAIFSKASPAALNTTEKTNRQSVALSREGDQPVITQKEIDARAARAAGRPVPA